MHATGIVRRVDDLGRIVLPKEIRRGMGIKDGTPMEILVNRDEIILKKYYPQKKLSELAQDMKEAVDDIEADLGTETSNAIKRSVRAIQEFLKQGSDGADMAPDVDGYECPVCKNEEFKPGQRFCQICGSPVKGKIIGP